MGSLNVPNRQSTVSPFSYLHVASSNFDSSSIAFKESPKSIIKNHQSVNNNKSFHQRCSSASSLILNVEDDQPSWLEDLLAEPETAKSIQHKTHRRSSSDSYAILEAYDNKSTSSDDKPSLAVNEKHDKEDPNVESGDSSNEKSNSGPTKSNTTKMDLKRAKQHSAHRSRVRKLKYINELESTVHMLQVEGSKIQAELEFLNQQNLMLSMENMALRQRLDNVSHEQLLKHFEQEMLEKELGRLKLSINYKINNKMQIQQQMMQR